tara:strand:+ start:65 stop:490 length:426 start_codon:yes stop_codon:yes gene_type:complete
MLDSVVYLASDEAKTCLKIGYSTNPERRMETLSSSKGVRIYPISFLGGGFDLESEALQKWTEHNVRGEWFEYRDEIVSWFRCHPDLVGIGEAYDALAKPPTYRLPVSLTEAQREAIEAAATRKGLSPSAFVRMAALEASEQ